MVGTPVGASAVYESRQWRGEGVKFVACIGKEHCTEGGACCRACGRSHEEIARGRELIAALSAMAEEYENFEEFIGYVGSKSLKRVRHQRKKAAETRLG